MIPNLIYALVSTLIIESFVLVILKYRNIKIFILEIIINTITNLSLNYFLLTYSFESYILYIISVIVLEILIVLIEGFFYAIFLKKIKKSLKLSLILNASSFLIGLLISLFSIILLS